MSRHAERDGYYGVSSTKEKQALADILTLC